MTERKLEEAYFYQLNRELIEKRNVYPVAESRSPSSSHETLEAKKNSFYDFLDRHLQPNEKWLADI